jgi:hypothetical protein
MRQQLPAARAPSKLIKRAVHVKLQGIRTLSALPAEAIHRSFLRFFFRFLLVQTLGTTNDSSHLLDMRLAPYSTTGVFSKFH